MNQEENKTQPEVAEKSWDESRIIVLLIGFFLIVEGLLIYYQAGHSQAIVAGISAVSGITLLLFAWLVPAEILHDTQAIDVEPIPSEPAEPSEDILPDLQRRETVGAPTIESEPIPQPVSETPPIAEPTHEQPEATPALEPEPQLTWRQRLSLGLAKTRTGFVGKLKKLVLGSAKIDEDLLDELEETLYEADVGVKTTHELLEFLHKKVEEDDITDPQIVYDLLREQLMNRLIQFSSEPVMNKDGLTVFLVIGVNGVGKTTTIAKLANLYRNEGKKVVLAAGDTFRAAAIDQISIWAERVGVDIIRGNEGGDPGALVFDAIHAARKREADLLIIDTAGRMHVKANLMAELKKVQKIAHTESDGGPHEILLVLDATTGQNAVQQAKLFNEALPISGLVITKLDGTAKGGVLFAVEEQIQAPVKFIGVGEKMEDLMHFEPKQFLEALFNEDEDKVKQSDYKVL